MRELVAALLATVFYEHPYELVSAQKALGNSGLRELVSAPLARVFSGLSELVSAPL